MSDPLVDELSELAGAIDLAPPADLTNRVMAAIDRPLDRTHSRWVRAVAALVALVTAVGVAAAASPRVRAAIADILGLGGVAVEQGSGPPPAARAGADEKPTTLAAASRRVGFAVRVLPSMGKPERVTVLDGRVVSLHYRGDVRLDQFEGEPGPIFEKYVGMGQAERVSVGGAAGLWFRKPTTLVYVDRQGVEHTDSARIAPRTLVWTSGAFTYRLEGMQSADAAIALALTAN